MTQDHIAGAQDAPGEILIQRSITFRNSTFGGLKAYIRMHRLRTGETLSNAAAVDAILRAYLARTLPRHCVAEMMRVSRGTSAAYLATLPPDGDLADAPHESPAGSLRLPSASGDHEEAVSNRTPVGPVIGVAVRKFPMLPKGAG